MVTTYPGNAAISHHQLQAQSGLVHVAPVGSGDPLILLHGWPEFWFTWEPVMMLLAKGFDVIVPDLRGFGDSSKPIGPYTARQHAQDLLDVADSLGLKQFGVVSHDVGGAVAQALAHAEPQRISGLFFFDFLYPGVGDRFFSIDRLTNTWYMFFQESDISVSLVTATEESVAKYFSFFLKDWAHRKDCFDDVLDLFVANFAKPGNVEGGFNYYRAAMPPRTNPPEGKTPPTPPPILLPTCVRWSQYDKLFDYAWTDNLPLYFPDLDLEMFHDVGHFPHREDPERAAAYIAHFFLELSQAKSQESRV